MRTYEELSELKTFKERFEYLSLKGRVGMDTFGHERYLNQRFYTSSQWRRIRDQVILRDEGCDLGVSDRFIYDKIIVHHMNPIAAENIVHGDHDILNPRYLICTTHLTHNAIHYGDESLLVLDPIERKPGDTLPWKQ